MTALRWARILRRLGHRLSVAQQYEGEICDLLIALHAHRSAESVFRFREMWPEKPVIVALTGTDLYRDLPGSAQAQRAVREATRLVSLQPRAEDELPQEVRHKLRVIYQSVERTAGPLRRSNQSFDICVVGHLRDVKDPFRAAHASRLLPDSSRIRILQIGEAMEDAMAQEARREEATNRRYKWIPGVPRARARILIASSRLLVLSSQMEGGANVISEAVVDHVPVLASRIPGSIGLLGEDYRGYFPVGETGALAELMARAESDRNFYFELKSWCARLAPLFRPSRELAAWRILLRELYP